jgi:hypothetical protein
MSRSRQARATRTAISPRFATSSFLNTETYPTGGLARASRPRRPRSRILLLPRWFAGAGQWASLCLLAPRCIDAMKANGARVLPASEQPGGRAVSTHQGERRARTGGFRTLVRRSTMVGRFVALGPENWLLPGLVSGTITWLRRLTCGDWGGVADVSDVRRVLPVLFERALPAACDKVAVPTSLAWMIR